MDLFLTAHDRRGPSAKPSDEYGNEVDADGRLIDLAPHGPSDLYDESGDRTPSAKPSEEESDG